VYLAEIEFGKVTRRARGRTRATADAGLQFGHLANDLFTLVEIVAIEVYGAWFIYGKSEIYHTF
jgi:hypothetical protein